MSRYPRRTNSGWPVYPYETEFHNYTLLTEPLLSEELKRLSLADSNGNTDFVSLQPCTTPKEASQDRYAIHDWSIPDGSGGGSIWRFRAIFDGHAGHETVDHTVQFLPNTIHDALVKLLRANPYFRPEDISRLLTDSVTSFDQAIETELLGLFPGGSVDNLSDVEIRAIINDDVNISKVLRCMRGTTVLISLVDPLSNHLWVASLGDCNAVLAVADSKHWRTEIVSFSHSGMNPVEVDRVLREHPGEPNCMKYNRVLGAIAVTRALGDHTFKLPATFTERVFLNCKDGYKVHTSVERFLPDILTPPYVSNIAEVRHVELGSRMIGENRAFLILSSDGLSDLYNDDRHKLYMLSKDWVDVVRLMVQENHEQNLALGLLRKAMGGQDTEQVSRLLTVERSMRWMDDTTILVQRL